MGRRGPISQTAFSDRAAPARGVGIAPTYISDEAKAYYAKLAELLKDRLEPEDESALAMVSQAMAEIAEGNVTLSRNGYVFEGPQGDVANPWVNIRDKAHKRFDVASSKLGLSPADRHRIMASLQAPEQIGGPTDFDKEHGGDSA